MTYRNRKLLDLAWQAPCMLRLGVPGCGNYPSVPCHSDLQKHGRGIGHKSHDCLAVAGCPACHAIFTREHLGREGYYEVWRNAFERYQLWLWENGFLKVAKCNHETQTNAACGQSLLTDGLEALRKLALRSHYYCEDTWYSCPKAEGGSANDAKGDGCDCGADNHNAKVERVFEQTMRIASNACLTAQKQPNSASLG